MSGFEPPLPRSQTEQVTQAFPSARASLWGFLFHQPINLYDIHKNLRKYRIWFHSHIGWKGSSEGPGDTGLLPNFSERRVPTQKSLKLKVLRQEKESRAQNNEVTSVTTRSWKRDYLRVCSLSLFQQKAELSMTKTPKNIHPYTQV